MPRVLDLRPRDGIIEFEADLPLGELRAALEAEGQRLPYVPVAPFAQETSPVGDLVLAGFPHPAQGRFGGWSDWLLGGRLRLPDGHVGFTGSRVVKSVAGYDLHRVLVGSGGALGTYETLVLRTYSAAYIGDLPSVPSSAGAITRVLPSLFPALAGDAGVLCADPLAACLWWREGVEPVRSEDDRLWPDPSPPQGDGAWFLDRMRAALGSS